MIRVLILNQTIKHYRIPLYNELSAYFALTIGHSGPRIPSEKLKADQKIFKSIEIGPFSIIKTNLFKFCKGYEVVISESNLRYIDRLFLIVSPFRKFKWIAWGIGVSASYQKKFDTDNKLDWFRHWIFGKADAEIFYSNYPITKLEKIGFSSDRLFVAPNTVHINQGELNQKWKNSLLFIGTLYKQKNVYELLRNYQEYTYTVSDPIPLVIIGDGPERNGIKTFIETYELKVELVGEITNTEKLRNYFSKAIACISPGQAGLSVLTSFAFGVPFITKEDSITGGERLNIINNENGVLYKEESELYQVLIDIHNNRGKYLRMGQSSFNFYKNNRTIKHMAQGFYKAIDYTLRQQNKFSITTETDYKSKRLE